MTSSKTKRLLIIAAIVLLVSVACLCSSVFTQTAQADAAVARDGAATSNSWIQTPNVMRWRYGQYDKNVNLIVAEAALKDNPVMFTVTKGDGTAIEGLTNFVTVDGVVTSQSVADILSTLPVGTYRLYSVVAGTDDYAELRPEPHEFKIFQGVNSWKKVPALNSWVEGKFAEADNGFTGEARFGNDSMTVVIRSVSNSDLVIYDTAKGIDTRSSAPVGTYVLTATVAETADYEALTTTFTFDVFRKAGMPWWSTLMTVLAALGLAALFLALLHQKGVLQILSGKIYIAVRNRATVDATIAAIRASKIAEEAKKSVARARAADAREARRKADIAMRSMSADEQAEILEQKAHKHDMVADKYNKRAESIRDRAEKLRNNSQSGKAAGQAEATEQPADVLTDTDDE